MIYKKYTLSNLKMQKLIKKQGIIAYAIYCYLQELIYKNNCKLLLNETTKKAICSDMQIDNNSFDLILEEIIFLKILKKIVVEETNEIYLVHFFYDSTDEKKTIKKENLNNA